MLNHITIMGRLVRDPELRYTQNQIPVTSFTLAVERDYSGKGQDKETDFIECVAWRQTAEFVNKYLGKGRMAAASGRLQIRDWTDKNGNKRKTAEVNADNVYFADSKKDSQGGSYNGRNDYSSSSRDTGNQAPGGYGNVQFSELDDDDGELPF